MSAKKRGLGRGLSDLGLNELLSRLSNETDPSAISVRGEAEKSEFRQVAIDSIQPGKYQPRHAMNSEALEELAESIKSQGVIQPIVVRTIASSCYEIIAGERRWRAAKLAGLQEIPVLIRDIPDEAAIAIALIENIQRENLNAIEEAIALQRLSQEFDLTHQEVASIVGKSRATISNLLRLLILPPEVKHMVEKGELEMGHARAILSLDAKRQNQVARRIVLKGMSVRKAELYIRQLMSSSPTHESAKKSPHLLHIEKDLTERLGVFVTIKASGDHKGKVTIHYESNEQFEAILKNLSCEQVGGK
jgi:ParB family chromosome partitioning protein